MKLGRGCVCSSCCSNCGNSSDVSVVIVAMYCRNSSDVGSESNNGGRNCDLSVVR